MQGIQYKMHVLTYDSDHGYRKEIVREKSVLCFYFMSVYLKTVTDRLVILLFSIS